MIEMRLLKTRINGKDYSLTKDQNKPLSKIIRDVRRIDRGQKSAAGKGNAAPVHCI